MSAPRYMLDTNICIYLRQNRPPEVTARFRRMHHGDVAISVITYGELLYGAERSQQRTRALESLARLVSLVSVLALPEEAAAAYGEIRAGGPWRDDRRQRSLDCCSRQIRRGHSCHQQ